MTKIEKESVEIQPFSDNYKDMYHFFSSTNNYDAMYFKEKDGGFAIAVLRDENF